MGGSTLLRSILLCSTPFSSILLFSALFFSPLFFSALYRSILLRSALLYSVLLRSALLSSTLFCSMLLCSALFSSGYFPHHKNRIIKAQFHLLPDYAKGPIVFCFTEHSVRCSPGMTFKVSLSFLFGWKSLKFLPDAVIFQAVIK